MRKATEVSAALIFRDGKFLICQRPAEKARGLLWEFAGGKAEPGETPERALVRECEEELGVTVKPLKKYMQTVFKYPDVTVRITLIEAELCGGEPKLLEHSAMKWISPREAANYNFCAADRKFVKKIVGDSLKKENKHNKKFGAKGEAAAAAYLKRRGYAILERNMRTSFGEVDIVAETESVLVFCEVKTRAGDGYGSPSEAVTAEKRLRYIRAARQYLSNLGEERTVRFDVIEVLGGKINHIKNAFGA